MKGEIKKMVNLMCPNLLLCVFYKGMAIIIVHKYEEYNIFVSKLGISILCEFESCVWKK